MIRRGYQSRGLRGGDPIGDDSHNAINQDRWLVSYADFMTLLMAFFVVMYSISQVSESKYRVLSNTFKYAFNSSVELSEIMSEGEPQLSHTLTPIDLDGHALQDRPGNDANEVPETFVRISEQLEQSFQSLIENELITVTGDERWLHIELPSAILFDSGGATLNNLAESIIGELSEALFEHKNVVRVEGFTDNIPIATSLFASNWELSSARASAVVRLMASQGIEPQRLAAIGYGEHQPSATNRTEEGRAKNRRIVLMVSTREELRPNGEQVEEVELEVEEKLIVPEVTAEVLEVKTEKKRPLTPRQQAEAWLLRMNQSSPTSGAGTQKQRRESPDELVTALVDEQLGDDSANQETKNLTESETTEGVKRIELNDGVLLFTQDTG